MIIIGFDSEWVYLPEESRNHILSYQFTVLTPNAECSGIVFTDGPDLKHRWKLADLFGYAIQVARDEKFDEIKMIRAGNAFPQLINFGVKSSILVEMLRANGLKNYRQARLKSNDEIRAVIKESVYLVVCYMTEKRRQKMAQKRRVFENLKFDFE